MTTAHPTAVRGSEAAKAPSLVARALGSLDVEDRRLLEWKYVDGETYPQLAARLGVPKHVAEYRVVTAKKRLRGLLVDIGLGEEDSQ